MQQTQQREMPERISWARAMVFGVGFFFLAAILVGQLPSYLYNLMTGDMVGLEDTTLALAAIFLAGFMVIQVIVFLFDPKPVLPPVIFSGLGTILTVAGLALTLWASFTGNHYFPGAKTSWNSVLGGKVLWFPAGSVDFVMLGLVILFVGAAMIFYSLLALREQRNPDRRDLGTTPAIRGMIIVASMLLIVFMVFYTLVNDQGLAYAINAGAPQQTQLIIDTILDCILGLAIFLALGAFALRLHYLMRPVRKRTMSPLYAFGALGLAQLGAIFLLVWFIVFPLLAWMHTWTFIGLGDYLTQCAKKTAIPQSCTFSAQAGYLIDAIITTNFFVLFLAAIWAWKSHRNLVIIGSVVTTALLGLAALLVNTNPDEVLVALLLCGGVLVLGTVWTSVARREFAVIGENKLGCLGMWLVVGTCLLIYLAAFAFFSIPVFPNETAPNVNFTSGVIVPPHVPANQPPVLAQPDAVVMLIILGALAAVQFFFLVRNRYKV
jgi:hypothetical protein